MPSGSSWRLVIRYYSYIVFLVREVRKQFLPATLILLIDRDGSLGFTTLQDFCA